MTHRILLVEDDPYLQDGLSELLKLEGYAVTLAGTVREAQAAWDGAGFDLAILDVRLPDSSGLALCRQWRQAGSDVRILFLTACGDELQVVQGLDAGGDDYVTKPFRLRELTSRIRAQLRREKPRAYHGRHIHVDFDRRSVSRDGQPLMLTPTEYLLLAALARNSGRTLTRAQLLALIWDDAGEYIDDNTLSVHMSRLREKLGPGCIHTARGVGYRWQES